jgi:hypothetical protein
MRQHSGRREGLDVVVLLNARLRQMAGGQGLDAGLGRRDQGGFKRAIGG